VLPERINRIWYQIERGKRAGRAFTRLSVLVSPTVRSASICRDAIRSIGVRYCRDPWSCSPEEFTAPAKGSAKRQAGSLGAS
jgi:hypothetical protein